MAKLISVRAELAVLRGMCHKDRRISGTLLGMTDVTHFASEESIELFTAIRKHMVEVGEAPTYRIMLDDPSLSREAREFFQDSQAVIQSVSDANRAAVILNKYRQTRLLYNLAAHINDNLQASKVDLPELLETASATINSARSQKTGKNAFLHFGVNDNAEETIRQIIWGDNSDTLIPTGIKAFDEQSGGIPRGALMTIGARSGFGKSLLANQLAVNMATMGYRVLLVPLEMSKIEMTQRTMANVTRTNLSDIIQQKISTNDRDELYNRYRTWRKRVKAAGGRYTIYKPEEDVSLSDIFAATASYATDVCIIDYVSLLKGTDGDDGWIKIGEASRAAKVNAESENRVNILLCQVNQDGTIRYARSASEHSSLSWIWTGSYEDKEEGIFQVEQTKSRNAKAFPFPIKMVWEHMRVAPVPASALPARAPEAAAARRAPRNLAAG